MTQNLKYYDRDWRFRGVIAPCEMKVFDQWKTWSPQPRETRRWRWNWWDVGHAQHDLSTFYGILTGRDGHSQCPLHDNITLFMWCSTMMTTVIFSTFYSVVVLPSALVIAGLALIFAYLRVAQKPRAESWLVITLQGAFEVQSCLWIWLVQ